VIAQINDMQLRTRLASATAAAVITVLLQVLIGLAFSAPASAQPPLLAQPVPSQATPADKASIERGRYLVSISGCNDCHTGGYAETGGKTPEADWLTGVPVGFSGPPPPAMVAADDTDVG
jgi:mono/diheme cytochrome c family protein